MNHPEDPGPSPERAILSRAELADRTIEVLNRGNRRNPDVLLVADGDRRMVVKDFAPRGALVRHTIGRFLTRHEARAYQWLDGHPSVPRFLGWIDPLAFAVAYRPGRRVSRNLIEDGGPGFGAALDQAVAGLHARGLVHLDLGHRSNVLVEADGAPVLIDFASAVWFRPGSLGARFLLPRLAAYDLRAVHKWSAKLEVQRSLREAAEGAGGGSSDAARSESRPT
ncbi:MAG: hypothetical protein HKP30_03740 [Myxococcales bacterium]|nr:hypothetical protein [Myxococcales bacterium]